MGQGNDLCDVGNPHFSLVVEMGRAIFECENMALGVDKYLTLNIFPWALSYNSGTVALSPA